jgi:hypothetical protein
MNVPAMAIFPLFPVLSAFKLFMATPVLMAGGATYAGDLGKDAMPARVAAVAWPLLQ